MKADQAAAALIPLLSDGDQRVREVAAWALKAMDETIENALIAELRDSDWEKRFKAAQMLGGLKGAKTVPYLIELLRDTEARVRRQAALSLGRIGDSRAVEALKSSLEDKDAQVRKAAQWALDQMKAPARLKG
jgi:HEAT repeat protein